jgi:hypothetical protein
VHAGGKSPLITRFRPVLVIENEKVAKTVPEWHTQRRVKTIKKSACD